MPARWFMPALRRDVESPRVATVGATPEPAMADQRSSIVIDRESVADYLRRAIAMAEALPRDRLHRRLVAPTGIALEMWFDDSGEADITVSRLANAPIESEAPTRIYVLRSASIGMASLPKWRDSGLEPVQFHAHLATKELRAAYPLRTQQWLALDDKAGIGIQLARSPADLPEWFASAPLRHHLHWLLRTRRHRIAHAATLGAGGRGILVLGHGGAGKSGTTLAGLAAGLQTVGDDYVALGGLDPAIARPLYRIVKQDRTGLARIAGLAERLAHLPENWMSKVEFDPEEVFPACFADALTIRAIVLPHVAHAPAPRLVEVGAGEAMRALMRTNLYQFPGEADDGLEYYANLLRILPTYRLELSPSAPANGAALGEIVAALS